MLTSSLNQSRLRPVRAERCDVGECVSAQPGWYDAGVPGQERWWDGTQWTAHERAVPGVTPVGMQPVQPQYGAPVALAAPMGWFPVVGTADVRWWDGTTWTPYRIRDRRVRADAFNFEPGKQGVLLGSLFIGLGIVQFLNYSRLDSNVFSITPSFFVIAGVVWLIGGFQVNQLKKLPAPSTVPIFDALTRPLPGEAEGAAAGWYPVSGKITRWWTGTQWSPYIAQKLGVRPTHFGPRSYRNAMILGAIFVGLGVLGAVLGFTLMGALGTFGGLVIAIPALVFALVGGLVLLTVYLRRYTLLIPPHPPTLL